MGVREEKGAAEDEMCLITLGGSNWVQLGDRNHTVT